MEFLIPPLGFWLIVWVVMASSSVVSSQNEVAWNHATRKELLELYRDRMPADMIAHYFGCTPAEIIRQLAYLVLGERRVSEDRKAPNYQKRWSWRDDQILRTEFQLRTPVKQIAEKLGRDRLGVAFRILGLFDPPIPKRLITAYGLDNRRAELRIAKHSGNDPVRICSQCHDVIAYCKCQLEELEAREGH